MAISTVIQPNYSLICPNTTRYVSLCNKEEFIKSSFKADASGVRPMHGGDCGGGHSGSPKITETHPDLQLMRRVKLELIGIDRT